MKVIICCNGNDKQRAEKYLNNSYKIVGYCSIRKDNLSIFNNKDIYEVNELSNIKFDYIINTIKDKSLSENMYFNLLKSGIPKNKIINFYKNLFYKCYKVINIFRFPEKSAERKIQNFNDNPEGLVLGVSHALYGINTNFLNNKFINLSNISQDMFFNYKVLELALIKYKDKFKNLKYIIFDLYTYTYFNFDVSLTLSAVPYLISSGFYGEFERNFKNNKNFNKTLKEELNNYLFPEISENEEDIFDSLFSTDIKSLKAEKNYQNNLVLNSLFYQFTSKHDRDISISDEQVSLFEKQPAKESGIQKNIFEYTEIENKNIFENILKMIHNFNENIKLYIILIPTHQSFERKLKHSEKEWKGKFYYIINYYKRIYNFEFLDFKDYTEISSNNHFYYDLGHLNYNGSIAFTLMLNSIIF